MKSRENVNFGRRGFVNQNISMINKSVRHKTYCTPLLTFTIGDEQTTIKSNQTMNPI